VRNRLAVCATIAALALFAGACAMRVGAEEAPSFRFARLGPPEHPVHLHFEEAGSGPTILMLHGIASSNYTWRHIAPELARTHRVIQLELKGFGRSEKPFDEAYSARDQAELIAEFMVSRKLRDVTMIGHSFGGGIALMLALESDGRMKGRIARLILLDSVAYEQNVPIFFRMLRMPLMSHVNVRAVPPMAMARAGLNIAYHDDSKITQEDVAAYARPLRSAGAKHAIIHTARQIVPNDLGDLSGRYGEIRQPTLIIWCEHDRVVPLEIGARLAREMPNASFRVIPTCGHLPQEEEPRETMRAIRAFLRG
jgi:pimeloyl-ACP methyl ester carboxylesterase